MFTYAEVILVIKRLLGEQWLGAVSPSTMDKIHKAILNISQFPFSTGAYLSQWWGVPEPVGARLLHEIHMLEAISADEEHIELYERIERQENNRVAGDIIDNHSFVVHGWAMPCSEVKAPGTDVWRRFCRRNIS